MADQSSRSVDDGQSELADLVSALITASRALIGISAQSLIEVEEAITLSEFRALVVLQSQGPATTPALSRRLGLGHDAAERVASRLTELRLVEGSEGSVRVTDGGRSLVRTVTTRRRALVEDVAARMDRQHRRPLVDALLAFAEAAGEPIEAGDAV